MAYMSQERKKELAPGIKAALSKHGYKGTIGVHHHSTLVINVTEGPVDIKQFSHSDNGYLDVNPYHYERMYGDDPKFVAFLKDLMNAANKGNHDRSDIQSDYFDVGWYVDINIGRWDKPFVRVS